MGHERTYVVGVALATYMKLHSHGKRNNPKNAAIQVAFSIVIFFLKAIRNSQKRAEYQQIYQITGNSMHCVTD
jgi:hypothetical protein